MHITFFRLTTTARLPPPVPQAAASGNADAIAAATAVAAASGQADALAQAAAQAASQGGAAQAQVGAVRRHCPACLCSIRCSKLGSPG